MNHDPIIQDGWLFYHEPCSVCHEPNTVLRFYVQRGVPPIRLCRECLPIHQIGRTLRVTIRYWLWLRIKYNRAAALFTQVAQVEAAQDARLSRLLGPLAELSL